MRQRKAIWLVGALALIVAGLIVGVLAFVIPSKEELAAREQRGRDFQRLGEHLSELDPAPFSPKEGRATGMRDGDHLRAVFRKYYHGTKISEAIPNRPAPGSAEYLEFLLPRGFSFAIKKQGDVSLEEINVALPDAWFADGSLSVFRGWCQEHQLSDLHSYSHVLIRSPAGSEFEGCFLVASDEATKQFALFMVIRATE